MMFFTIDIYNCAVCQRFEYMITTQSICKHKGRLRYMSSKYSFEFFTGWFCPVYARGNYTAITLDARTDGNIFI